jgi:sterol 3beta-glucosyltransferase
MRVQLNTFGTEGDIRPFVALAKRLVSAGHDAAVCTSEGYAPLVAGNSGSGVEHLAMDDTARQLIRDAMPSMRGPRDSPRLLRQMLASMRQMMADEWRAAQSWRPDVIVYHPKCLGALHIADRLDIPAALSLPLPFFTSTSAYPIPCIAHWPLGGRANRASYQFNKVTMLAYGGMINAFRRDVLGLAARRRLDDVLHRDDGSPVPILYAYSPHLVPVPDDYPDHAHVTGPWFDEPDPGWMPPADLERFLAAGPPPVYLGFGSMGFARHATDHTDHLLRALLGAGQRVVLATGWGGLTATSGATGPSDQVHTIEAVPHGWLFPRTAAVIHHGGSGTTSAGLAAGRPTLICPYLGDQPFWGHRVHVLGAGPPPIPQKRINGDRAKRAIQQLADPAVRHAAGQLGQLVTRENGIADAIRIICRLGSTT